MSAPVAIGVFLFAVFGFFSLIGLEAQVNEALRAQQVINFELQASLQKAGIQLPHRAAGQLTAATLGGGANFKANDKAGDVKSFAPRAVPAVSRSSAVASVIVEPPMVHDHGQHRDRDGRQVIDKEEKLDTDSGSSSGAAEEIRLTPAPPPPRPVLPTIPPGRQWPAEDPNHGFEPDLSLPSIGVITLNAQAGVSDGIGLAAKSSWMHRMSYTNKQAYCKKWGYDLIIEDNSIIDKSRDVAWSKIPIFKKWLPKYQWLMWVDMDAFFMRFDLPIIELANNNQDLIIAKDWHGINFGVFLIRNSPWAFSLLDKMWRSPPEWWKPWEEQSALMALTDPKKNPGEAVELLEHITFPRQRDLNSYGAEFAYGNLQALYRAGDRIVHFPNCKGFQTCRSTIESFYRTMLQDNGIEELDANEIPASQFPEGVL